MLGEAGPSAVTGDLTGDPPLTAEEIRERMSGNLCRCGAYVNIVAAVGDVAAAGGRAVSDTAAGAGTGTAGEGGAAPRDAAVSGPAR
jgi:xanthine dehydrogenase iron-sulfur cluster and FAD-binding subunit A